MYKPQKNYRKLPVMAENYRLSEELINRSFEKSTRNFSNGKFVQVTSSSQAETLIHIRKEIVQESNRASWDQVRELKLKISSSDVASVRHQTAL